MKFYARGNLHIVYATCDEEPKFEVRVEFPFMDINDLVAFLNAIRFHVGPLVDESVECDDGYCDGYCEDLETIIDLEGGEQL